MSNTLMFVIELIGVFGLVIAFAVWDYRKTVQAQEKTRREAAEQARSEPRHAEGE